MSGSEVGEAEALAEDKDLIVASADEYARTRRVKEIMDAKRQVKKARRGKHDDDKFHKTAVAEAVAEYGAELEPLMEQTELGQEILYERNYLLIGPEVEAENLKNIVGKEETGTGMKTYLDLIGYAKITDSGAKPPEILHSIQAYRDLNEFVSSIGLELSLEEPTKPAQI